MTDGLISVKPAAGSKRSWVGVEFVMGRGCLYFTDCGLYKHNYIKYIHAFMRFFMKFKLLHLVAVCDNRISTEQRSFWIKDHLESAGKGYGRPH